MFVGTKSSSPTPPPLCFVRLCLGLTLPILLKTSNVPCGHSERRIWSDRILFLPVLFPSGLLVFFSTETTKERGIVTRHEVVSSKGVQGLGVGDVDLVVLSPSSTLVPVSVPFPRLHLKRLTSILFSLLFCVRGEEETT